MLEYDNNKTSNLNEILHLVKIASLAFSAVAFFQYYFKDKTVYSLFTNDGLVYLFSLIIIFLTYALWNYLQFKKYNNDFIIKWIQPAIFIGISFLAILLTGGNHSSYKFLFLFIIVSTTIESGMKTGIIVSAVCSGIIFALDIALTPLESINTYFESDIVLACAFLLISWTTGYYVRIANEHIDMLKNLVNIDGLTGLYNHRHFFDILTEKIKESEKEKKPLSLLFIDIDYFKYFNDLNGHQRGDEALKIIANILTTLSRENDIVARYGGEEFAVLMPDTTQEEAIAVAEKIRHEIQEYNFSGEEYLPNKRLTISVGIAGYPYMARSEIELIKYADEALYRAKFLRKNRVEAYTSILDDLQDNVDDNDKELITSIKTLIAVINARDKYTYRHVDRVVSYCKIMADKLQLDEHTKKNFIYGAYMHDIGKINISKDILMKVTPLTSEEWEILKAHSKNGADIIKGVALLKDVVPIILQHHERYDGKGYPSGLKGNEIYYLARLLTVIDSFDAMTSNRPYQKKKSYSEAVDELIACSGTQFDPEMVQLFVETIKEIFPKAEAESGEILIQN